MILKLRNFTMRLQKFTINIKQVPIMIRHFHPSFIISFPCKHDLPRFAKSNNAQSLKFTTS